ncbi:NAD(P)/FAD-dependent oxidoreductase [Microbacterium sp. NPDC055357]
MSQDTQPSGPAIVVIGAGVAGLSAAYSAARIGARSVTVLEKTGLAAGSSALSAGIYNRQTFDPLDLQFRVGSGPRLAELERETSFRVTRSGYMRLARTEQQWMLVRDTIDNGTYPDTELLDAEAVARLVPGMRVDDVVGAMYGPEDGHMDGPELCAAYLAVARRCGVEFRSGVEVLGSTRTAGGIRIETTTGSLEADIVINATGSWLSEVGERLGAPVPIENQLHEIALMSVPSLRGRAVPTVQTYFPGSGENAVYIRPEGSGMFLAGLHSYESEAGAVAPGTSSRHISETAMEELAEALFDRFPDWTDASIDSGWSGVYPLSPDGRFIIGPSDDRVVTLGGLGGVGLNVSAAVGALAAEWAVYGEARTFHGTDLLLPTRFAA